ncbi:hypothetical protein [Lactobacillus xylocopicola]|uniref:Uncharacterized protein n=1 Tax=Lactobacillus xylocopicola TaxID=2976676 RepID=A0ABN6SMF3_9LACO|nr:hypothetical protein [Lactobacillus xylocopicola]BDR60246.1 hypothetical protein KIM322_05070 [Lactobacillus xylocopicola]
MTFWGIIGIVLLAVIILSMIFAVFHIFLMLLPAVVVIAVIIWLINHFTKDDRHSGSSSPGFQDDEWPDRNSDRPKRKKVRDAETKDVDK